MMPVAPELSRERPEQLARRILHAPVDIQTQIARLLQHAEDDEAWAEQLGPVYRQADVARLLGRSKQAVAQNPRLLRLEMRSGRIGYPVFQFDGRAVLDGIGDVVEILTAAATDPWTIASWLRSPKSAFDGREPIELLRDGDVEPVVDAARSFAASWGR